MANHRGGRGGQGRDDDYDRFRDYDEREIGGQRAWGDAARGYLGDRDDVDRSSERGAYGRGGRSDQLGRDRGDFGGRYDRGRNEGGYGRDAGGPYERDQWQGGRGGHARDSGRDIERGPGGRGGRDYQRDAGRGYERDFRGDVGGSPSGNPEYRRFGSSGWTPDDRDRYESERGYPGGRGGRDDRDWYGRADEYGSDRDEYRGREAGQSRGWGTGGSDQQRDRGYPERGYPQRRYPERDERYGFARGRDEERWNRDRWDPRNDDANRDRQSGYYRDDRGWRR